MARPTTPLISPAAAAASALALIDEEGLDAFSMPRLARRMGVRAPSLYHHFEDRNAILAAVARAVTAETVMPRKPDPEHWQEWFVAVSLNLRAAILRHRRAGLLLLQFPPHDVMTQLCDDAAKFLTASGVPVELQVQLLDGLEVLAVGASVTEASRASSRRGVFPDVDPAELPHLANAISASGQTPRQLFEDHIRAFLRGVLDQR